MRVSRIAAITVMGAAVFGVSATSAYADSDRSDRSGQVEASPHVVKPGHVIRFSTESCHCGPAKVHVTIDQKRYWVKLAKWTDEGKTGWFKVPRDTDPGRYEVEGHCHNGRSIEGTFWVAKEHKKHHEGHHRHHHHHHCED
ncbi:MAG: hypothetical protein HOV87_24440 [Catenulispora sp.]|nr:hypothetical protein [Catenulispora sp.]